MRNDYNKRGCEGREGESWKQLVKEGELKLQGIGGSLLVGRKLSEKDRIISELGSSERAVKRTSSH